MSDDLISRKAFMEYLGLEDTEENREENVGKIVTLEDFDRQATAFDKEKVIEKLKDQYNYSRKVRDKNNNVYFEYWDGRTDSYKDAIEIVEKGGIE